MEIVANEVKKRYHTSLDDANAGASMTAAPLQRLATERTDDA